MSEWHALPVSDEQRRAFAAEAAQKCREQPEFVEKMGERLALAFYSQSLLDHARCGHVSPYRNFIQCICEDDDADTSS